MAVLVVSSCGASSPSGDVASETQPVTSSAFVADQSTTTPEPPTPSTTTGVSSISAAAATIPAVRGLLLGCSEFSLAQVDPSARIFLEEGGLVVETADAESRLTQADPICRSNPDAVEILQSTGAWTFDSPAKKELGCSDYDASVLAEHTNIFNDGQVLLVDDERATYVLDSTSEACLNNPDAVALFRSEGLLH